MFACSLASLIVILATAHHDDTTDYHYQKTLPTHRTTGVTTFITVCIAVIVTIITCAQFVRVAHNTSIETSRYVGQSTVLYVQKPNIAAAPR